MRFGINLFDFFGATHPDFTKDFLGVDLKRMQAYRALDYAVWENHQLGRNAEYAPRMASHLDGIQLVGVHYDRGIGTDSQYTTRDRELLEAFFRANTNITPGYKIGEFVRPNGRGRIMHLSEMPYPIGDATVRHRSDSGLDLKNLVTDNMFVQAILNRYFHELMEWYLNTKMLPDRIKQMIYSMSVK